MKTNILARGVLLALTLTLTIQPSATAAGLKSLMRKHPVITGLAGISAIGAVVAVRFLVKWYRAEKKKVETKNEGVLIMPEADENKLKENEKEVDFQNIDKIEVVTVEPKKEGSGFMNWLSDKFSSFKSLFNKKEVKKDELGKETENEIQKNMAEKLKEQENKNMENNFKLQEDLTITKKQDNLTINPTIVVDSNANNNQVNPNLNTNKN